MYEKFGCNNYYILVIVVPNVVVKKNQPNKQTPKPNKTVENTD